MAYLDFSSLWRTKWKAKMNSILWDDRLSVFRQRLRASVDRSQTKKLRTQDPEKECFDDYSIRPDTIVEYYRDFGTSKDTYVTSVVDFFWCCREQRLEPAKKPIEIHYGERVDWAFTLNDGYWCHGDAIISPRRAFQLDDPRLSVFSALTPTFGCRHKWVNNAGAGGEPHFTLNFREPSYTEDGFYKTEMRSNEATMPIRCDKCLATRRITKDEYKLLAID